MAKTARVYVTLKRGVLDPQGSAVNRALHAMGFGEVSDVRLGKFIEVTIDEKAPAAASQAAREGSVTAGTVAKSRGSRRCGNLL